ASADVHALAGPNVHRLAHADRFCPGQSYCQSLKAADGDLLGGADVHHLIDSDIARAHERDRDRFIRAHGFGTVAANGDILIHPHRLGSITADGDVLVYADLLGAVVADGNLLVVSDAFGAVVADGHPLVVLDLLLP